MTNRPIIVTQPDMDRLSHLIRAMQHSDLRDREQVDALDQLLQNAEVRPPNRTPKTVVTIGSNVMLQDGETRKEDVYTLVFPEEADISRGFISVLAPLGLALLGRRKGDLVEARVPTGIRRLRIQQVARMQDYFRHIPEPSQAIPQLKPGQMLTA